jgi:undecaprenyl-diphosphatase
LWGRHEEDRLRGLLHRVTLQDQRLLAALAGREAPGWIDRGLRLVTHAGGASATVALCLVLLLVPGTRHLGVVGGIANLLSHLLVQGLKRAVVRRRPTVTQPHIAALASLPDHFSFPSGHACAAMAVAASILVESPLAGLPILALALAVGVSRVYLRVHYVTDVVVGQMLGAATAVLVAVSLW